MRRFQHIHFNNEFARSFLFFDKFITMVWLVSMTFVQYQHIYKKTKINLCCLCFLCYFTWISEVQVVPFINLYDWFFRKLVSLTSNKITKQWRQVAVGDEWSKTKGNEHSFCVLFSFNWIYCGCFVNTMVSSFECQVKKRKYRETQMKCIRKIYILSLR